MAVADQLQGPEAFAEARPPLDAGARQKLLAEHLPEVRYIARRIHGRLPLHVPLEDLVHAGVIGLIDAVDKFNPLKRVQLKSYAKFRIRGAILDSLRASDWSPRSLRRQARRLREAHCEISAALGRSPTETELAGQLGMDLPDFQQLLSDLRDLDVGSLQAHSGENLQALSVRQPDGPHADPFSLCLRAEMKSHLVRAVGRLEARERQVLALYYSEELTMRSRSGTGHRGIARVTDSFCSGDPAARTAAIRTALRRCGVTDARPEKSLNSQKRRRISAWGNSASPFRKRTDLKCALELGTSSAGTC